MDKLIDGKALAESIQQELKEEIITKNLKPNLAVVLVGDDSASQIYVNLKKKACHQAGIEFHEYLLDADCTEEHVLGVIDFLNKDNHIDAILIQLPLPKKFDTDKVIKAMSPAKDVDGFHPQNIEKFLTNQSGFVPGLSLGIFKLIVSTEENLQNKQAVIIAKSDIFYRPLAKLLNDQGATTTIAHPDDKDIKTKTSQADILVAAAGQPFFVTADMVKDNAIVIDVGTNKIDNNYVVGDVDYSAVFQKASHITPVPGGVGPMTVAMLLYNTVRLAEGPEQSRRAEKK
jgi:methylenetetrahydrofolate dehydrogenase (NADP+) / methenyltetrahydrofolate cyclohydrolase